MKTIYEYLESEIQKALPKNWELIPDDKLLGDAKSKIKYAFKTNFEIEEEKLIYILALDLGMELNEEIEKHIITLRDYIISKNSILFVIVVEENSGLMDDVGVFESEKLRISHANYFYTYCSKEYDFKSSIDGIIYEDLNEVIQNIWNGSISYNGVTNGKQFVNLEIMKDTCHKCNSNMKTVTGIVFPDIELQSWNNDQWQYYLRLFPLSQITSENATIIKTFVENLRMNDKSITKVDFETSNSVSSEEVAATCPKCNSVRGEFYVVDNRMQYLHDFDSRLNGQLAYHSIILNITQDMIEELSDGYEGNPHACDMGWY